ncbi:AMP-binding protein [Roseobacter litoralis]|uniref:AMP-binding enzyme n=1 Tax=Roseobacter litoralis (strain ATCC 49566 / DSM 6996 / JCM 21268 / NBRC 15278 / OCh 149) TaxID=391595 RepID=F7ZFX5_ROSLO|nr:AMP-binding protein [Roseobacter litoralis]AEI93515.1 AMP-binding enzyme [Roseobacter litoralis Och 149]
MKTDLEAPPAGTVRNWLDHRATQAGTALVFSQDETVLSWRALRAEALRVAWVLTRKGARKGESIAILHPNGRTGLIALYGALYGGFRATMVNLVAGRDAISYALEHSEARFALVHEEAQALFDLARPDGIEQVDLNADPPGTQLHSICASDHALLMYTSGTTGQPKGVVHTHASLLAGGWTATVAHDLSPHDRGLCVLPIYHINGLCVSVMGALVSGGSLAVCPRFSARSFWEDAARAEATWFSVVPTIISHLLHSPAEPDADTKTRLRFGRSASSALAPEVQTAFEQRFEVPIIETMGLTETAAQILSNPLPPGVRKIGSPGCAYGNQVAVLDSAHKPCAPGVEGEIAVRGPNVMLEYLKNPQATQETFAGDWLRTGDLGRMDADGYFFVTGRLKELIIKGGENIAPREIDEALYAHGDVIEAAAFGRPCQSYGETVEAAVKVRAGSQLSSEDLIQLCQARLGPFKSPDHVHFLDDLPKGPSGKIQRRKLLELIDTP